MDVSWWVWALFTLLVLAMLALDLGVASRGEGVEEPGLRSAVLWSGAWISLALLFGVAVWPLYGAGPAVTYFTAYVLEKSLSVDNVFVFVLIFSELGTPPTQQRKVLYWGVLGALAMRGILIAAGLYLIVRFHWLLYPFAVLVLLAAARLLFGREKEREVVAAACSVCDSWVGRILPITPVLHRGKFLVRQRGRLVATPLLIALIVVETTDVVFALDSIPAAFAVTREPLLLYTSNVFAMLGLRSLYFVLAGALKRLRYLRLGLAGILAFVGGKMLLASIIEIPSWTSLAVIVAMVAGAVAFSLVLAPQPLKPPSSRRGPSLA
jgi:tellurite resistance protein TerC